MASAARNLLLAASLGLASGAVHCAEWAVAPVFFFNADHESNRTLQEGTPESESLGASLDLDLARRTEAGVLSITPHYYMRRLSPQVDADVNDLRVPVALQLNFERSALTFGASYADESTLTTELAETGAVRAGSSRIMLAGDAGWRFSQSDARQLDVSANYQDVNYTGNNAGQLYDYRYAAFSARENFAITTRSGWSLGGFASKLRSEERGSNSAEAGVSVGFDYDWSQNTHMAGTLGFSRREFDGVRDQGRSGNFSFSHHGEKHEWGLVLDQSLVPYGSGTLTEQDSAELHLTRHFDSRLQGIARLSFTRNDDIAYGYDLDARTYRYADTELRWQLRETWSASIVAGYSDAQDPGAPERVGGWMLAVRTYWAPNRHVLGP